MNANSAVTMLSDARQWLNPVQIGTSTIRRLSTERTTLKAIMAILHQIEPDAYIEFMIKYYEIGLERFGECWEYLDQLAVLYAAATVLKPERYLEIGVFRGRSMCVVASVAPECDLYGFDMWIENYSGLQNIGPTLVRSQLERVGHRGKVVLTSGPSIETVPAFLQNHADLFFDLITVDGDHSAEGAREDLQYVVPRVKLGGVLVFDDICHPLHPWLERVWDEVIASNPNFIAAKYTEVGHGVAFAIRRGIDATADALNGDSLERTQQLHAQLKDVKAESMMLRSMLDDLQRRHDASEADRAARLEIINRLQEHLQASEADRAARLEVIERLNEQLRACEADRAARLEVIERLKAQLDGIRGGRDELVVAGTRQRGHWTGIKYLLRRLAQIVLARFP